MSRIKCGKSFNSKIVDILNREFDARNGDGKPLAGYRRAVWPVEEPFLANSSDKRNEAHLVMMGYLQRVVNGGGRIAREMALGSKRLDLCVEFGKFRYAVELKMRRNFSPATSYAQLAGYLDHLGLSEGWMAVFDEDKSKPWDEKLYIRDETFEGKTIHVIGL